MPLTPRRWRGPRRVAPSTLTRGARQWQGWELRRRGAAARRRRWGRWRKRVTGQPWRARLWHCDAAVAVAPRGRWHRPGARPRGRGAPGGQGRRPGFPLPRRRRPPPAPVRPRPEPRQPPRRAPRPPRPPPLRPRRPRPTRRPPVRSPSRSTTWSTCRESARACTASSTGCRPRGTGSPPRSPRCSRVRRATPTTARCGRPRPASCRPSGPARRRPGRRVGFVSLGAAFESAAVQQLVHTATAADPSYTQVRLLVRGATPPSGHADWSAPSSGPPPSRRSATSGSSPPTRTPRSPRRSP